MNRDVDIFFYFSSTIISVTKMLVINSLCTADIAAATSTAVRLLCSSSRPRLGPS